MNIWIFNHYAVGPGSSGITRHYDLGKELVKKGAKVTIFASSFNYQKRVEEREYKSGQTFQEEVIDGVRFVWFKTIPYTENNYRRLINMLEFSFKAWKYARKHKEKPTHIVGSLMHPFAAIAGALVAKKKKVPFIFEERDLWPQSMIDLGHVSPNHPKTKLLRAIERWLLKSADRVLILFAKASRYMEMHGVPKEKIMLITNGIDEERYKTFESLPSDLENLFESLEGKLLATYTGAHGMANNLDMVLDAAKKLDDRHANVHFLLLGDGVHKKNLMKRASDENITNVTFIDSINKNYIPTFLSRIHVGLLPLHNSPVFDWGISPNKMYDYMAASLPVVLLCNIEETTIQSSKGGIIIKQNQASELARVLEGWEVNREEPKQLGVNGKNYVHQYCTWNVLSEQFMNELKGME